MTDARLAELVADGDHGAVRLAHEAVPIAQVHRRLVLRRPRLLAGHPEGAAGDGDRPHGQRHLVLAAHGGDVRDLQVVLAGSALTLQHEDLASEPRSRNGLRTSRIRGKQAAYAEG